MKKKLLSSVLSLAMICAVSIPTFAGVNLEVAGGSQRVPVDLTVSAATFSVSVPTALPISVAANGSVTTANDAKIVNNSHGAVRVTNMAIEGADGWETVNWNTANMGSERVGSTKVAMMINGDKTIGDNAISFTASNFPKMDGVNAGNTDELPIIYDAKVPAQATSLSDLTVANVIFTVGWDAEVNNGSNNNNNNGSEPEKDLISFSFIETDESEPFNIDSAIYTTYYAEKDMTWGEWVDSDYNVNELSIGWDNCVVLIGGDNGSDYVFLTYSDGIFAIRDGDLIEAGVEYTFTDDL